MLPQNTYSHGRTTVTQRPSLFDTLLSGKDVVVEPYEEVIRVDLKKQNSEDNSKTKSMKNLGVIFYQKKLDYEDFKISLKYNNKALQKIAMENIKEFPSKVIKQLGKNNLIGLIQLKFKDIPLMDNYFDLFKPLQGLSSVFPILQEFSVSGSAELTTKFLTNCFVNTSQPQTIEQLDLSHTKIDAQGMIHLSGFQWPKLYQFVLQWCNKINDFTSLSNIAKHFPKLRILDFRFTLIDNSQIQKIISSDLIYILQNIRVYGSNVNSNTNEWNTSWILNQILTKMMTQNKMKDLCLWKSSEDQLLPNQRTQLAQIKDQIDVQKGTINCIIFIDLDLKIHINWKWHITLEKAIIFINENFETKSTAMEQVSLYIQKSQKRLKKLDLFLDNQQIDQSQLLYLGDSLAALKDLFQFSIRFNKQSNLDLKAYYYLFDGISQSENLQSVQLDLHDNNLKLDQKFFDQIIKSIQKLSQLNTICINLDKNLQVQDDVRHFINRLVYNFSSNVGLQNIFVTFDIYKSLGFKVYEILDLYFGNHLKNVTLNQNTNVIPTQTEKIQQKFKELVLKKQSVYARQMLTIQAVQNNISQKIEQYGLTKNFRKEIIQELVAFMYH